MSLHIYKSTCTWVVVHFSTLNVVEGSWPCHLVFMACNLKVVRKRVDKWKAYCACSLGSWPTVSNVVYVLLLQALCSGSISVHNIVESMRIWKNLSIQQKLFLFCFFKQPLNTWVTKKVTQFSPQSMLNPFDVGDLKWFCFSRWTTLEILLSLNKYQCGIVINRTGIHKFTYTLVHSPHPCPCGCERSRVSLASKGFLSSPQTSHIHPWALLGSYWALY